jgi:lipopolysaccharide/colanic/teichoic acid biosynthesis glycosyltransferase
MNLLRAATNASVRRDVRRRRESGEEARPFDQSRLISEELFRDALGRERKRADRFEEAFVVLLVSLDRGRLNVASLTRILEALSQSQPGADIIGWFEGDSVLGLIRSVEAREPADAAMALANAFRYELARCLSPGQADCCSIRCEAYSSRSDAISPLIFEPDRHPSRMQIAGAAAKRLLDIVGSACALIVFAPVFLFVAAIVKWTSKGPVFFRQQRVGAAGQPFTMFKFRTMQTNCDHRLHQQYVEGFIQSGAGVARGDAPFKLVNDPRVTPVGDFLRRSSLDELPQFLNVLRGEMSLVGPRPPLPYEVARYKRWHRRRVLEAKPGMTGLWQVTGRSRTTFDDMVRLDLRYAAKCSVWTDVKILAATPKAVLSGKGAR